MWRVMRLAAGINDHNQGKPVMWDEQNSGRNAFAAVTTAVFHRDQVAPLASVLILRWRQCSRAGLDPTIRKRITEFRCRPIQSVTSVQISSQRLRITGQIRDFSA